MDQMLVAEAISHVCSYHALGPVALIRKHFIDRCYFQKLGSICNHVTIYQSSDFVPPYSK